MILMIFVIIIISVIFVLLCITGIHKANTPTLAIGSQHWSLPLGTSSPLNNGPHFIGGPIALIKSSIFAHRKVLTPPCCKFKPNNSANLHCNLRKPYRLVGASVEKYFYQYTKCLW